MLAIKQNLLTALATELETLLPGAGARAAFESPKVAAHGDFASTAAMQLAKPLGKNPRQVAEALRESLLKTAVYSQWVEAIDIAGPGFMNIKLKPAAKQEVVREILSAKNAFGNQAPLHKKMMVEFVSANPTGPLHVGHGKCAAVGDSLSKILMAAGYQVSTEYYINDHGKQMDILGESVLVRYRQLLGEEIEFLENGYQGDYIVTIAKEIKDKTYLLTTVYFFHKINRFPNLFKHISYFHKKTS